MPTTDQPDGGAAVPNSRSINTSGGLQGGGDLTADRTISIADDGVTLAKLADIATARILGRATAGTGNPEALTGTQATALLDTFTTSTQGLVPAASGGSVTTQFLRKDGTWTEAGDANEVNVLSYGAVGDNITDDATPIANAWAAAEAAGKNLRFPHGYTFYIGSSITFTGDDIDILGRGATIRYDSTVRTGITLGTTSRRRTVNGLTFQGENNDDKTVNLYAAIVIADDVTDITVEHCRFEQCKPLVSNDSLASQRLRFERNYVHNPPNAMNPTHDALIFDNDFANDNYVTTRAQFIYSFGQQVNIAIIGNRFKNGDEEDIQIRATNPRWDQRSCFRIEGNHFENSRQYSIWFGSDDHPDIGSIIISGNTFRNCVSPIFTQGAKSPLIANNLLEWDFEFPSMLAGTGCGITCITGVGLSGRYQTALGPVVKDNKLIIKHPFLGSITLDSVPCDGHTLTVGEFTYTWRTTPTVEFDIEIGGDERASANNLCATIRGVDGRMTAPNNALRYATDVFNNFYGSSYGESNDNIVYVASWYAFPMAETGGAVTLSGANATDYKDSVEFAITVEHTLYPVVEGNAVNDIDGGIVLTANYMPTILNNVSTTHTGTAAGMNSTGNIFPVYSGNRFLHQNRLMEGRPYYSRMSDAFPVVEDGTTYLQDYQNQELLGRAGTVDVGDGKAFCWLYYGMEVNDSTVATRPYRWDDGDRVGLHDGVSWTYFYFKRTAPGAGEFNDADSLLALINATGTWTAAYAAFQNNTAVSNPKLMIRITHAAGGATGNSHANFVWRFIKPTDTTTYQTVPQPLFNGIIMRDKTPGVDEQNGRFYGGAAALTKTWVFTPIVHPTRGVFVQGVDSTSVALAPVVYQADIVEGVGFYITHGAAAGTEAFFWRVN
jgi:hypothetical protein